MIPTPFRAALVAEYPELERSALSAQSWERLERTAQASPLYARELRRSPNRCLWLESERALSETYAFQSFLESWTGFEETPEADTQEFRLGRLRRWRRMMSMRIAHRSVNELAAERVTVEELSELAEFCLRECWFLAWDQWRERFGAPSSDDSGGPARFCVLALGKLGGMELNFSSDIDLICLYENDGQCRRPDGRGSVSNAEFFTKIAETMNRFLADRTADGFLFRVDSRLRPEGAAGPLVRSYSALESYYGLAGQTWERLALLKARPVAGDLALGSELLEDLHSFRYPRRPPPTLLAEIAAMKLRGERELSGEDRRERNIKIGRGGIREIEFVAQALQVLNAGRFPFLQTHSTVKALGLLARYGLLAAREAAELAEAYWFLRRAENRLQMQEEEQVHELPADPEALTALAASLGFASAADFGGELERRRTRVREVYKTLFAERGVDNDFEDWWAFFAEDRIADALAPRLAAWFHGDSDARSSLRGLVCGDAETVFTRERITRFQPLAPILDILMPTLARPGLALGRLDRFAARFGTRQHFLSSCGSDSGLLRVISLLADRSGAIMEILCAHPEIFEEVIRTGALRSSLTRADVAAEIGAAMAAKPVEWLRLFIRAEQIRHVVRALSSDLDDEEFEDRLTVLADAVLEHLTAGSRSVAVALGQFGGRELAFGSDLDLLFVAPDGEEHAAATAVDSVLATLGRADALGPVYKIDLRLRPHGEAGMAATSVQALADYHAGAGGRAWERQSLLRARVIGGPPEIAVAFEAWRQRLLFSKPLDDSKLPELWSMRARIERLKSGAHPGSAFKNGPGGRVDIEFLVQVLQLRHGHGHRSVRATATRAALRAFSAAGIIEPSSASQLLDHHAFLKRIEHALRRDSNRAVDSLPMATAEREALAHWIGFPNLPSFEAEHRDRRRDVRALVLRCGGPAARAALAVATETEESAGQSRSNS